MIWYKLTATLVLLIACSLILPGGATALESNDSATGEYEWFSEMPQWGYTFQGSVMQARYLDWPQSFFMAEKTRFYNQDREVVASSVLGQPEEKQWARVLECMAGVVSLSQTDPSLRSRAVELNPAPGHPLDTGQSNIYLRYRCEGRTVVVFADFNLEMCWIMVETDAITDIDEFTSQCHALINPDLLNGGDFNTPAAMGSKGGKPFEHFHPDRKISSQHSPYNWVMQRFQFNSPEVNVYWHPTRVVRIKRPDKLRGICQHYTPGEKTMPSILVEVPMDDRKLQRVNPWNTPERFVEVPLPRSFREIPSESFVAVTAEGK